MMDNSNRLIELLSPAKNLECGMEAINHGADAVYIGAPRFSARAAAGNTTDDIRRLCDYAHVFGARIYVALNTILKDNELREAERMIKAVYDAGADALIIQDMGITRLDIPPIALHASTQADNRTVEKLKFLEAEGFSQAVLARELSLGQMREMAEQTNAIALEVFIHGSLCVSYSGQCYISAALSRRSANRGECAQYCRLPYTWTDADGQIIAANKHLLSLKDLNRSDYLEELLDAGISSLKIEGRLKDLTYVKNLTAWYRNKLDAIFAQRPCYRRASAGKSTFTFEPQPDKSFNRGFTPYFLHGRIPQITAFDTPKSTGEPVGRAKDIKHDSFRTDSATVLHNGDGLAFFRKDGELEGFRVNRVEAGRAYPQEMPRLLPGVMLYRNHAHEFEKLLAKTSALRKIEVSMLFTETASGFSLKVTDETEVEVEVSASFTKETANRSQEENIRRQLLKSGNTPFEVGNIDIRINESSFVPSSLLANMRRDAINLLEAKRKELHLAARQKRIQPTNPVPFGEPSVTWLGNVSNTEARTFYLERGAVEVDKAFELSPRKDVPLMYTKHCLRYSMGWCPVFQDKQMPPYKEPFYLLYKNTRLKLQFDCRNCQMLIFAAQDI